MVAELSKAPPPVVGETGFPPLLKADIALSLILPDLAIDFSIGWFLLVLIFFNKGRSELRVSV
jgi:hypothetical protein